jgi:hypothetical protein
MWCGNGELMVEIRMQVETALADATNAYQVRLGFGGNVSGDFTNGIYFEYNYAVSPNWYYCRAASAQRTKTDTGIPVEITKFHIFKILVNSTGTEMKYFIDGALVGTYSAVSEFTPAMLFGVNIGINSSAGTINRDIQLDWISYKWIIVDQYISTKPSI